MNSNMDPMGRAIADYHKVGGDGRQAQGVLPDV